jgi:hypothetical protein
MTSLRETLIIVSPLARTSLRYKRTSAICRRSVVECRISQSQQGKKCLLRSRDWVSVLESRRGSCTRREIVQPPYARLENAVRTALRSGYPAPPVPTAHREGTVSGCYSPATDIRSIRIDPVRTLPRRSTSLPTATIFLNMSFKLPAIVISSTGY